jgi:LasA protease
MTQKTKRRLAFAVLFFWILPIIACNFPTRDDAREDPFVLDATMQAFLSATPRSLEGDPPPVLQTPEPPPLLPDSDPAAPGNPAVRTVEPGAGMQGAVISSDSFQYQAQSGDTLPALALRFEVEPHQITSTEPIPPYTLIPPGQLLTIPNHFGGQVLYPWALLPDSEIVYSPSAADFDTAAYIAQAGGYLSTYGEDVDGEWHTAAQSIQRAALETSTNPRILLSVLKYQSGWVRGSPRSGSTTYPMGFVVSKYEGLYKQLILVQRQLTIGYYGWRTGTFTQLPIGMRVHPELNAGSVALQHLFSVLYKQDQWQQVLYGHNNFLQLHTEMFGDPWARAAQVEPLFPADVSQPLLELPFRPGEPWNLTGGPHAAWGIGSAQGGLDFAPSRPVRGCTASDAWALAAAPGVITRSERGLVILDLDGDGREQTGWSLMYLHIGTDGRTPIGTLLNADDPIGHPSCEGGVSTGTHIHLARKYNGEWIASDGPLPFTLSGWVAFAGEKNYQGGLIKDGEIITAQPGGSRGSQITR